MTNKREYSHNKGIPLELTYEMRKNKAIIKLQEQVRKLTMKLIQVKGSIPL